jgi:hypothetical protein
VAFADEFEQIVGIAREGKEDSEEFIAVERFRCNLLYEGFKLGMEVKPFFIT